jgi:hypothetical protein
MIGRAGYGAFENSTRLLEKLSLVSSGAAIALLSYGRVVGSFTPAERDEEQSRLSIASDRSNHH